MEVHASPSGRSWVIRDGGREVGLVTLMRGGRHLLRMYCAWSAASDRCRFDLGTHARLSDALERVEHFDREPERFAGRVHRVSVEAIDKRR